MLQDLFVGIAATFGALLPIANPFSTAPVFATLTRTFSDRHRLRQAKLACIYMVCVLLGTLVAGALILEFFGITVPVMRIAGGLIIARLGFGMVSPEPEQQVSAEHQDEVAGTQDIAFTPIAMPLLSGPGAIAVTISMATTADRPIDYLAIACGIVLVAIVCWLVLRSAVTVVEHISATGMNVFTRLMGFILVCIGIQFVLTGAFEGLSDPDLVRPVVEAFQAQP